MKKLLAALAATCAISSTACAEDMAPKDWFVHLGGSGIFFDSGLVQANNPAILNATVTNNFTATAEIGRYLTNNISLSLAAGIPPTNDLMTTTPLGTAKSGTSTYGSIIAAAQYHFTDLGAIKPYIGAGVAYNITFSTTSTNATPVQIDNGFGAVLQAGVEADIDDQFGVFLDVKKMFAQAHVTKGAVIEDVRLNPWIASAGVVVRF